MEPICDLLSFFTTSLLSSIDSPPQNCLNIVALTGTLTGSPILIAKTISFENVFTKNGFPINLKSQSERFNSWLPFAIKAFSVLSNETLE